MSSEEKILCEILPGIVKGFVCDGKTGEPVAGAEVTVFGTDALFTTGKDGGYLILLSAASYTLLVEAAGYQAKEVEIKITFGKPLTQDIKLKKMG